MKFRARTAIVTGGLGALGQVIVRAFLREGANVAVPHRETPTDPPAGVFLAHAELSAEGDVAAFTRSVHEKFGGLHILVNAAGGYSGGRSMDQVGLEEWDRMMESNLKSAFLMSRAVIPLMRSGGGGRIISLSAMPALHPSALRGPYAIAKQGVNTLTEILADEVKGKNITVNAIAPSIIATNANSAAMPDADRSNWVTPEEIAALILFLCGEDARSINGNVIRIFGGM